VVKPTKFLSALSDSTGSACLSTPQRDNDGQRGKESNVKEGMYVTSSEGMKIKHCLAVLPSEEEGDKFSIYLDYRWRRRHHRYYRSSRQRGSSGRRGSDRRDISSDGWHGGGSNDGRLRHGWRDVLERGRRGDGRHGHCLLCSFQTTKRKHTAMY